MLSNNTLRNFPKQKVVGGGREGRKSCYGEQKPVGRSEQVHIEMDCAVSKKNHLRAISNIVSMKKRFEFLID